MRLIERVDGHGNYMDEPQSSDKRTWLHDRVLQRVQQDWCDVTWFALLADSLGINIAVWEPAGVNRDLQIYQAIDNMKGLFLYDKKDRMDEEGPQWLHLLFHTMDKPFAAWAGVKPGEGPMMTHNHFSWMSLSGEAGERFKRAIGSGQQQAGGPEALRGASSGLSTAIGGRGIKRKNTQPEQSSKTNDGGTSKKPVLVMSPRTAEAKDKGKRAVGSGGRGKPVPGKSLVSKKQGGVQDKGKKQAAGGGSTGGGGGRKSKDLPLLVCYDSDGNTGIHEDFSGRGSFA
ncbi:unnamed protein product, partial [Pylaiella littoralis]